VRKSPGLPQDRVLPTPGLGARQPGRAAGLRAAQLRQSRVPVSALGAGTGREGRKRRKSRNGCMVSTGFPVPPHELRQHQVQTAPAAAPGGRQCQPGGRDLAARAGWRGCAPAGRWQGRGPLCGAGGVWALALWGGHGLCRDMSQHPAAALLLQGRAPRDCSWDQFGSQWLCWSPRYCDTSRLGTFPWGSAPHPPPASSLPMSRPPQLPVPACSAAPAVAVGVTGQDGARATGHCGARGVTAVLPQEQPIVHGGADAAGFDPTLPPPVPIPIPIPVHVPVHVPVPAVGPGARSALSPALTALCRAGSVGALPHIRDAAVGWEGVRSKGPRLAAQALPLPRSLLRPGQRCHGLRAGAVVPAGAQRAAAAAGQRAAPAGADEEVDVAARQERPGVRGDAAPHVLPAGEAGGPWAAPRQ